MLCCGTQVTSAFWIVCAWDASFSFWIRVQATSKFWTAFFLSNQVLECVFAVQALKADSLVLICRYWSVLLLQQSCMLNTSLPWSHFWVSMTLQEKHWPISADQYKGVCFQSLDWSTKTHSSTCVGQVFLLAMSLTKNVIKVRKTHSSTWLLCCQNLEVACTLIQKLNDASHAQTIQNAEVTWVPQHSIIRNLSHLCYSSTKLLQFATRRQTAPTPSVTQRKAKVQIAVTSTVDAPTMTRKPSNVLHVAVKLAVEKVTTVYYIRPLISNTVFAGCSTQTVKLWAVIHTTHMYTLWNRLFHANSYEKMINVSDDKAVSFWSK